MNYKHLLFIIFSLIIIIIVLWNYKSKLTEPLVLQRRVTSFPPRQNASPRRRAVKIIENNTNCCGNDPLFLAIKNSGEISILKEQVNEINNLKQKIGTLETETQNNSNYIEELQKQFMEEASSIQTAMETPDENESQVQPEMNETSLTPQEQSGSVETS